jgi:hypothetical protein
LKGKKIKTLAALYRLAKGGKSVVFPRWHGKGCARQCMPAAFMINMQGLRLHHIFELGLWEYKKEK